MADVPVRGNGAVTHTNRFGKAVITDVNSYYRNQASIDLDTLPDDVEATQSVIQGTLTEGAIGYRSFDVIAGAKGMVTILMADRDARPLVQPPKIAAEMQDTGIVGEEGSTYLSGMQPGETMTLNWGGNDHCRFTLPDKVASLKSQLELLCQPLGDTSNGAT